MKHGLAILLVLLFVASSGQADTTYLSPGPIAADANKKLLYIAQCDAHRIDVFSIPFNRIIDSIKLEASPGGIVLHPDKKTLFASGTIPEGKVYIIDLIENKIKAKVKVGHSPGAMVISPNGKELYVCNRFSNDISIIDLTKNIEILKIPVRREPIAIAITPDSHYLFVANNLPAGSATSPPVASVISVIDAQKRKVTKEIQLPNGSTDVRDICLSPDGHDAYVTHILGRYQLPTSQIERGWMNTNALSIIDADHQAWINTILLDDYDQGAANPWAVVCGKTNDREKIYVSHYGTGEISVIDKEKLYKVLNDSRLENSELDSKQQSNDLATDLSLMKKIQRRRIQLKGKGPYDMVFAGQILFVTEYFSDSITKIDVSDVDQKNISIPLGPTPSYSLRRRGEILFHDATLCFQHWQSCASCHPAGRSDALNWDLLNDGIGNPKNTKSLLLSHQTPPSMARGIRDCAETAVQAGIHYILNATNNNQEANSISEYLKSLQAVPGPYLIKGHLGSSAERGKHLFEEAGCMTCHTGPLFTDLKLHNIGSGKGVDMGSSFDTPSLIENWRTAPYLHDGRAATIQDVLTTYNTDDKHGMTSNLSQSEIKDLAEYILSQ